MFMNTSHRLASAFLIRRIFVPKKNRLMAKHRDKIGIIKPFEYNLQIILDNWIEYPVTGQLLSRS